MPCVAISLLFAIVFFFFLPLQRLIEISAVTNSGMQHAGWIEAPLAVQAAKKCQIGLWECTLALTYTRIHTPVARNAYAVACQRITVPLKWLMHKQTQSQIYSHGLQRMHHSSITHPLQASKRWLMHSATTTKQSTIDIVLKRCCKGCLTFRVAIYRMTDVRSVCGQAADSDTCACIMLYTWRVIESDGRLLLQQPAKNLGGERSCIGRSSDKCNKSELMQPLVACVSATNISGLHRSQ